MTPNPWRDPAHARHFDGGASPANPGRERQVEALLALAAVHRPRRILDAGCGPGLLAERLLDACPGAALVAFDFSAPMVERARARLGARARVLDAAFEGDWEGAVGRPFDLVVCVQALHHLDDGGKRATLGGFFRVLDPGGLYLQSDPVSIPDERLFPYVKGLWDRACAEAGIEPLAATYGPGEFARDLEGRGDRLAPLDAQLAWLRASGFDPVHCFWLDGNRAIFGGWKPR